jgi:PEP-CTERM motif
MRKSLLIILAVMFVAISAPYASASITPTLDSGSPSGAGPFFTWTYTIAVDSNQALSPTVNSGCSPNTPCPAGSFFTLYDIVGLTSPSAPANWGSTIQLTGITPSFVSVGDDPAVENLTFFYTGPAAPGPLTADGFSFQSTSNVVGQIQYAFSATSNGVGDSGRGFVAGPAVTPEPGTFSLMLLGAGMYGLTSAMRKRKPKGLAQAT